MRITTIICTTVLLCLIAIQSFGQDVVTMTEAIDGGTGGLAVDNAGNIYIGDFGPDLQGHGTRIFRVTPAGEVSVFASGFEGASGNDFDSQGNLFQSNINGWRVDKVSPDGTVTPFADSGIYGPVGIAIDDEDNLYVCNCGTNNIRLVTPEGAASHFTGGALFQCPNGITLDDDGNVYVANFRNGDVIKIVPGEAPVVFATIPGDNNGHLTYHDGLFYVAARSANQIYTISMAGEVALFAGTGEQGIQDGPLLEAKFSLPNDVIVDPTGTYLYVNDVVDPSANDDISPMVLRRISLTTTVGVETFPESNDHSGVRRHSVAPNPFRKSTAIAFGLERPMSVHLTIHDLQGRKVQTLIDETLPGGGHEAVWTGRDASGHAVVSGVYFYRLTTDAGAVSGRIHLLR